MYSWVNLLRIHNCNYVGFCELAWEFRNLTVYPIKCHDDKQFGEVRVSKILLGNGWAVNCT